MIGTFILVGAAVIAAAIARPALMRSLRKRRLMLVEAQAEHEAREAEARKRAEAAAAVIAAQPDYFRSYGIKVAATMSTPRVADKGVVHLKHGESREYSAGNYTSRCDFDCGYSLIQILEVGPASVNVSGVSWRDIGSYCPACGAWLPNMRVSSATGILEIRMRGATNLFDVLGDPRKDGEEEWSRLERETAELEARLNETRARRLALAEKLGKSLGAPFRPQLVAGGKES